jgi:pyrimidine operon attenuation protein/uracil phosphoribosyltransferase
MGHTRTVLSEDVFKLVKARLAFELIENHNDFENTVLIGLQPRGVLLARAIKSFLEEDLGKALVYGELDITFFRDDFRQKNLIPSSTNIDFITEGKKVILIDDVMHTGRSVRAALDAIQQFGRPSRIELMVLVDRRWSREIPVSPDYCGIQVDSVFNESIRLNWNEQQNAAEVVLHTKNKND